MTAEPPVPIGREATSAEALDLVDTVRGYEPVRRITADQAAAIRHHLDTPTDTSESSN